MRPYTLRISGKGKADATTANDSEEKRKKKRQPLPYTLRIRCQHRNLDEGSGEGTSSTTTTLPSKSKGKGKTQNWRDNLKQKKPEKYAELQKGANIYSSYYRAQCATAEETLSKRNLSKEEREEAEIWKKRKERNNETARNRMNKMNAKKKADVEKNGKPKKAMTRREYEKKKAYEAERKRKQRAKKSAAEIAKINEKRREKYAAEKYMEIQEKERLLKEMEQKVKDVEEKLRQKEIEMREKNAELDEDAIDVRSNAARRKSLQRVRRAFPEQRSHFVSTAVDLVEKASPRKAAALNKAGIKGRNPLHEGVMEAVADALSGPKKSAKRKQMAMSLSAIKKYKLQRQAGRYFGCSRKLLKNAHKKSAGRRPLSLEKIKLIQEFYDANSNPLPDKKLVSKKTYKPRHVMEASIANLYQKYTKAHPDQPVSAGMFYSCRPKHVKTRGQAKYIGCLCEYCENVNLKVQAINSFHKGTFKDGYNVVKATMCPKPPGQDFNHYSCITRKCKKCGVHMLDQRLQPLLADPDKTITWKRWTIVKTTCHTQKGTKEVKKRKPIEKQGTMQDLVNELKEEITPFSEHLFNKDWQSNQERNLRENLQMDEVLGVYDFAENFKCEHQREVQSAYYSHDAATVHPVVTYYNCPTCLKSVTESIVMVSDDLIHDYHLVHEFHSRVTKHLTAARGLIITKFYRFSDGCSSQYKSKGPISDISYGKEDFGHTIHHNFSGTRHGKGASDGESGVVKRQASEAIRAGTATISTPEQLYCFLKSSVTKEVVEDQCCCPFRRSVIFVKHEEVSREQQDGRAIRTVKGTRKLHSIRSIKGGTVGTRNLSCFCYPCLRGGGGRCANVAYVQPWKQVQLSTAKVTTSNDAPSHDAASRASQDVGSKQDVTPKLPDYDASHVAPQLTEHDDASPSLDDAGSESRCDNSGDDQSQTIADDSDKDGATDMIEANNFVAVRVENAGKKNKGGEMHVAKVVSVLENGYSLSYMVQGSGNLYTWPQGEEVYFIHPQRDIVCKLPEPDYVMVGSRLLNRMDLTHAKRLFQTNQ